MIKEKNSQPAAQEPEKQRQNPAQEAEQASEKQTASPGQMLEEQTQNTAEQGPETEAEQQENAAFSWNALEYIQQHRGPKWYAAAGIILTLVVVIALVTFNWTMAIAAVVFAGVYEYIQRHHPPKRVQIKITDMGIRVGEMFFPFSSIRAFWILYENGLKTLNLRVHRRVHSDVVIQLEDQNPAAIRQYLVGEIPEWEGKHESLQDVILRILKF